MRESDFQTKFTRFLKSEKWTEGTAVFELKYSPTNRFQFCNIKPHQLVALRLANKNKLVWKIEDAGYLQKPFDCFCIEKTPAYFSIMYASNKRVFFLISVDKLLIMIENGKKSLTYAECQEVGRQFSL